MCIAISYLKNDKLFTIGFNDKNPKVPIQIGSSKSYETIWGRRKTEHCLLPYGGWITLDSAKSSYWQSYFPKLVKISAKQFMAKDTNNKETWFDVPEDQCIQGLLVKNQNEERLYIITVTRHLPETIFILWPYMIRI